MRVYLTQHNPPSLLKSQGDVQSTLGIPRTQTPQGLVKLRIPGDSIRQLILGSLLLSQMEHELGKRSLCVGAIQTNVSSVPTLQIYSPGGCMLTLFKHPYSCQRQLSSYYTENTKGDNVSLAVSAVIVSEEIQSPMTSFYEEVGPWEMKCWGWSHSLLVPQPHLELIF